MLFIYFLGSISVYEFVTNTAISVASINSKIFDTIFVSRYADDYHNLVLLKKYGYYIELLSLTFTGIYGILVIRETRSSRR